MTEQTERNETIYRKKKGIGYDHEHTYRELSDEYELAIETIQAIVSRIETRQKLEKLNKYENKYGDLD